jgi:hypothetical protein
MMNDYRGPGDAAFTEEAGIKGVAEVKDSGKKVMVIGMGGVMDIGLEVTPVPQKVLDKFGGDLPASLPKKPDEEMIIELRQDEKDLGPSPPVAKVKELASGYLYSGDRESAERLSSQAIEQAPGDLDARRFRMGLRLLRGDSAGAKADAAGVLALAPQDHAARIVSGQSQSLAGVSDRFGRLRLDFERKADDGSPGGKRLGGPAGAVARAHTGDVGAACAVAVTRLYGARCGRPAPKRLAARFGGDVAACVRTWTPLEIACWTEGDCPTLPRAADCGP